MRVGIVGAGMAGLACAEALVARGHQAILFDKGRGPGGRMSTRRLDTPLGEVAFDHGAQYFTARDSRFAAQVADWAAAGVAAPWPAAGPHAWVGTPGMNAPVRAMADRHDVRWNATVTELSHDGAWRLVGAGIDEARFDAVVIAVPAEQVRPLAAAHDPALAAQATTTRSDPCWTVMAAFATPLPIADDVLRDAGPIGWAARNGAKPGRSGHEAWVIQATPAWSRDHLEDDKPEVEPALLHALAVAAGADLPPPVATAAHRWRYARSGALGAGLVWNAALRLGACGDWLLGPRIESAWLSGTRLGNSIA